MDLGVCFCYEFFYRKLHNYSGNVSGPGRTPGVVFCKQFNLLPSALCTVDNKELYHIAQFTPNYHLCITVHPSDVGKI